MSQNKTQLEQDLLEMIAQFTDDYIDEWTDDGNELDKLHEISDDFNHDIRKTVANHLLGLTSLQPLPRIKSIHADNSLAIKIDDIRQEIAEALSVNIASKD